MFRYQNPAKELNLLRQIMALAGKAGDSFKEIMGDMGTKAGQTDIALEKITSGSGFKLRKFLALSTTLMITLGDALATVLIPVLDTLATSFDDVVAAGATFFGILAITKIQAIGTAIMALTVQVRALTLAMAANPITAFAGALAVGLAAMVLFRKGIDESTESQKKWNKAVQEGADIMEGIRSIDERVKVLKKLSLV